MVRNNIQRDFKVAVIDAKTTQEAVAKSLDTSGQYLSRMAKKRIVNRTFERAMEVLGYDIELVYHARVND